MFAVCLLLGCGDDGEGNMTPQPSTGSDDGPSIELGPCARYLGCAVATDEIPPGLFGTYGEQGTCWGDLDENVCWSSCLSRLSELRGANPSEPACEVCETDEDCAWVMGTCANGQCVTDQADGTAASMVDLCSLSVVDPARENPIVAADEAGRIPAVVGEVLERNCGCHYTSNTMSPYVAFQGGTQLQTLANFTGPYAGANTVYTGQPAYEAVYDRVVRLRDMPMSLCDTEEGGTITASDLALLTSWLEQDVPDGANFTP